MKRTSHHQTRQSTSVDYMSNYSLHGNQLNTRLSNISNDTNLKYGTHMHQKHDGNEQSWFRRKSSSLSKLKQINPPKSVLIRQTRPSNALIGADRTLIEVIPRYSLKAENLFPKHQSASLYDTNHLTPKSILRPKSHSLTDNNNNQDQIWVKRHRSHSRIEHLLDRRKSCSGKEIIDMTV